MTRNIALLLNILDYNGLLIINVSAKRPYYDCDTVRVCLHVTFVSYHISIWSTELKIKILFLYFRDSYMYLVRRIKKEEQTIL